MSAISATDVNIKPEYCLPVPINNGGKIYNCNNGCGMMIFPRGFSFDDYLLLLNNVGFDTEYLYFSSGNRFATLYNETSAAHLAFIGSTGETRVVYEPNALRYPRKTDYNKICESELHGISLDQENIDCGMTYIIKADDGSLFVIDGGYFTPDEDKRLLEKLRELSGGKKPVINGWFFSHGHNDHIGCFMNMTKHFKDEFTVEGFYYNFPSLALPEAERWSKADNDAIAEFYEIMEREYSDVPHYRPFAGDRFVLRNLEIEVLFTHELIYPDSLANYNDSSAVIAVNICSQKILFLGDMADASEKLCEMYGSSLKSDMVQVAHHGFNGSCRKVYELADADVTLWPTADYRLVGDLWRPANHFLAYRHDADNFISGFGSYRLKLPYHRGDEKDCSDRFPPESEVPEHE